MCPNVSSAQTSSDAYQEFRTLIAEIKTAVSDNNLALALHLLSEASMKLNTLEKRSVLDEEAVKWDLAQITLDRADSMENKHQIAHFANQSVERWLQYIEWYKNLNDRQRRIIDANPNSSRIQRAVRQLGNAIMRRDNIPPYTIRYLFEAYLELPVEYVSSQSVTLWKNWLFRCPTWKPMQKRSFSDLRSKFASGENACRDDWEDFLGFLEDWVETQSLTPSKRRRFSRWVRYLRDALN